MRNQLRLCRMKEETETKNFEFFFYENHMESGGRVKNWDGTGEGIENRIAWELRIKQESISRAI